ncbi:MAG: sirohydrochlorin chelatase [Oceanipulchritudo sp.]
MKYLLVDNGSLRAESVLNLRRVAGRLSAETGLEILPASLLHSSKVPADQLEGEPAVNLERRIRHSLEAGEREFTIIPFFFGPSGAITQYLPERLAYRREKHGDFKVWRAPFLFLEEEMGHNDDLLGILADNVRQIMRYEGWVRPKVALVDHGSPLPEVTAVRDALATGLADALKGEGEQVAAASMERREGEAYAFNEPLLENLLDRHGWDNGKVIISMLFLSPGRHAGPGGDIARICRAAEARHPGLRTCMTGLVGDHAGIVPLLQRRLEMERVAL